MSISVYIKALCVVDVELLEKIHLYNGLIYNNYKVPDALQKDLKEALPELAIDIPFAPIRIVRTLNEGDCVERDIPIEGDVMYGDGAIIKLKDLPPNTKQIKVYTRS